jgi:hypothetical protein
MVGVHGMGNRTGQCPEIIMNDLIYVGVVVAFFAGCVLYVRFCEKL